MDINIAIDRLGLNANRYKLTQSVPPHSIVEWNGPDPQPTESEMQSAWDAYQAEGGAEKIEAREKRAAAYRTEADPLFFQYQAGEVTKEEWLAKREEIRTRYPYPS